MIILLNFDFSKILKVKMLALGAFNCFNATFSFESKPMSLIGNLRNQLPTKGLPDSHVQRI